MDIYGQIKLDNATIPSEGSSFKKFPVPTNTDGAIIDVVEDVTISKAELATAENGSKYLKIEYAHKDGATLSMIEFPIDAERTEKDKLQSKLENQLKRLKHVVTKYYGDTTIPTFNTFEALVSSITSFEDLANKVIALLSTAAVKATPVRLKCIYNYKNMLSVPSYVPFIELMSVSKNESRLKIDPTFDKIIKDVIPTDSSASLASAPTNSADLPF